MKRAVKIGLPLVALSAAVGVWVAVVKFLRPPK